MRVGRRQDKSCSNINTTDGRQLSWVNEIRYLGVVIVRSVKFKCSVDQAKRSFYRAANSIFAKVGRLASEEIVVELLKCKCLPVLLYALEVCNLNTSTLQSLDFTLNRFLWNSLKHLIWKLLHTVKSSCDVIYPVWYCGSVTRNSLTLMIDRNC